MFRKNKIFLILVMFSALACIFIASIPFIFSLNKTPAGMTWSPLNSQDKLCTDARVYSSIVNEVRENIWVHANPISQNSDNFVIDKIRRTSYLLSSALTLGLSDYRWAYVVSLVLGITLSLVLLMFCSKILGLNSWSSLCVAWLVVYFQNIFAVFQHFSFSFVWNYFYRITLNMNQTLWLDKVNDSFRYVILSTANVFSWLTLIALFLVYKYSKKTWPYVVLFFLNIVLIYSYTSIVIFGAGIILAFLVLNWTNKRMRIGILITSIASVLTALFALGLLSDAFNVYNKGLGLFAEAHLQGQPRFGSGSILFVLKLLLPVAGLTYLLRSEKIYSLFAKSILMTIMLSWFGLEAIGQGQFFVRIFSRGGNFIWSFILFSGLFLFVQNRRLLKIKYIQIATALSIVMLSALLMFNTAETIYKNSMFYMPTEHYEVYNYLNKNTSANEIVFSFDYRDIQLIPSLTQLDLAVPGAEYLEEAKDQFLKLVSAYNWADLNKSGLVSAIENYIKNEGLFVCLSAYSQVPKAELDGYMLLKQILYDPYVKNFGNIPIRDSNGNLDQDFIREYELALNNTEKQAYLNTVNYWILKRSEYENMGPASNLRSLPIVFENKTHIVLKN